MKAIAIRAHGGLDQLSVLDLPKPEPKEGEVRLKMAAGALNHLDLFTVEGIKGLELKMPHILGAEGAGTVDALGAGVSGVSVGDRVTYNPGLWCGKCAACQAGDQALCDRYAIIGEHAPGSLAEFLTLPARNLVKLPPRFPFEEAAAASLAFLTAYRMVVTRGKVKPGETVLVLGAGSGLSTALIQLSKHLGARVFATTSSDEKVRRAKALGAEEVFNYRTQDWGKEVFLATGKKGVDIVFDSVGKATLNTSIRSVRKGGRVVVPGGTTGQDVELNLRYLYWRQIDLLGSTMGSHTEYRNAMNLVFDGKVKPIVSHVFPVAEARKAFETMARGEQFGKLVVRF